MVQVAIAVLLAAAVTGALLPLLRRFAGERPTGVALLALLPGFFIGAASPSFRREIGMLDEVEIGLLVPVAVATVVAFWAATRESPGRLLFGGAFVAGLLGWASGWGWGGMALPGFEGGVLQLEILSIPFSAAAVVLGAAMFRAAGPLDGIAGGLAGVTALALAFLTSPGLDEPPATHAAAVGGACLALAGWRMWSGKPQTLGTAGSFVVGALLAMLATRCGANATGEPSPLALGLVFAVPALALPLSRLGDDEEPGLVKALTTRGLTREKALGALMTACLVLGIAGVGLGKALPGEKPSGGAQLPQLETERPGPG